MNKIFFILLIALLFCCSNKEKTNKATQEQEIMLERERILKLINDKENNVLKFNYLLDKKTPEKNEREVDISQCTKVTEGFFVNGIENKLNNNVSYYDKNGNYILGINYGENGKERSRIIFKYNEKNEETEYSFWGSIGRDKFGIYEKKTEDDRIIFRKIESKYNDDFELIGEKTYKKTGNLLSEIYLGEDSFFSYKIYNDKNDVVFYGYNDEKSNGIREEKYDIEYDPHIKIIKAYENENQVYEIINSYSKNNLLQKSVKTYILQNKKTTELYTYGKKNNLIEEKYLDENDNVIFVKYYQYDKKNRKIKEGEKRGDYERYWIYEYLKAEKEKSKPIKEQTYNNNTTEQKIPLEREKILNQLNEKDDKVININNLFEINIPKNFEIVSTNQYLLFDRDNTQYGIENSLCVLYQSKFFYIEIRIYGNTNRSFLDGSETYNLRKIENPSPYSSRNQVKYLKENYVNDPFTNKNKVKISKYFSSWGTEWSSDYYGLYFKLPNKEFDECVISIFNIWGTFAKSETIDENYKTEIKRIGGNLEKIFNDLEIMENSISYKLTDKSIKIENGSIGEQIIENEYIYPVIDNLRIRSQPSQTGEVLGYMKKEMYRILVIGEEAEIGGIKGNWLLIMPEWGDNSASWVFSGYTRKATEEEMDRQFSW